jgi:hypothetical protein
MFFARISVTLVICSHLFFCSSLKENCRKLSVILVLLFVAVGVKKKIAVGVRKKVAVSDRKKVAVSDRKKVAVSDRKKVAVGDRKKGRSE